MTARTIVKVKMTGAQKEIYIGLTVICDNIEQGIYGEADDFDMKDLVEDINSSLRHVGETPEELEARLIREFEKEAEDRKRFAASIKVTH